jgi:hypothetical protein
MEKINQFIETVVALIKDKFAHISTETLGWLANIVLHAATIPTFLAVGMGLTDKLPGIDIILLIWGGLTLLFARAIISRDMLNVATIGVGFIIQAVLLALIFFK